MNRYAPEGIVRFADKITKSDDSECWIWTAQLDAGGYGRFKDQGRVWAAHRWSYTYHVGPIADGLQIDHLCRVTACVNPAHLEAVTPRENVRRSSSPAARNAAKTACDYGHPLSGANLGISATGRRLCRACHRRVAAASRKRRGSRS